MEISAIKEQLSLLEVLKHYNLQPKNNMLKCFMHDDKTASLQVNLEKNFYKCHACGKTGDVIQFIEDYEKISKHEAIKKAESLTNNEQLSVKNIRGTAENLGQADFSGERSALFLENTFSYFRKALYCSNPAKQYIEKRNLDNSILEIGYNSGQFHHGERKSEELINNALGVGLLLDKGLINNRTGEKGYSIFANKCIAFPLKNKENQIVSFYFRSILEKDNAKHFYLKNRSGIYPGYPKKDTEKLILTEAIIDCASLLQIKEIRENYSLISCFGTNGLNDEILQAIKSLENLEEIIFCFDNDKAGKEAIKKHAENLRVMNPAVQVSSVELPNKDVNETLQLHDEEIFTKLLEERKFIFSTEENSSGVADHLQPKSVENMGISTKENLLSGNRTQTNDLQNPIDFLQQKELLQNLNELIEKAGIIGEENSRLLLFLITISYLNKSPLHGIVQGSSGSGKTHIISRIADMMPQEDVLRFTRITESSLYNWGEFDLFQKIIIIEDLDGLKEDALYALREFISNQVLRSSVTIKDKKGNNKSSHKIVKGQFSSLSATTRGETYEDNMSRSFLLAVDESKEQTQRIIQYQNRRNAGEINRDSQEKAIGFIQKLVRNLKHYEVINPYATKLQLPEKVHKIRRLNEMYQAVIKQVTFINQFQREVKNGFLITEIEDIEQATEVLFESIVLKVDELDGSLRQFYERLKKYVKSENQEFILREIRQEFNISKTQMFRHIQTLVELEYIKQVGGFSNKGIKYKISYWDNHQKLRTEIKEFLQNQIRQLKNANGTQKER
ncbi:CHC2 zinc finger domain-containing protein [Chryseobacterium balustinum]|uniref:DNA primase, catalytic core n=1 Tax=Chryseobacterium balustinum TaxID=246 RepID=A0ABY1LFB5_9FLAO|nr:CHC2 zinc finger domain-containing protein [Chryseobacterium balustinum]AZB30322.1 toprim domain-containing protein [Chryseobacterium balustinum]AZB30330.1 toprim domain-containing protein [Chryseobacterium balustinum]SKC14309.1 DNA primase, catalytic core [Chryseobacterium balustinum]